jgi:intein/homing endonuclease
MDNSENLISEEELDFCETWLYPVALLEILFHDFDNLSEYSPDSFGNIRQYQIPMISHEAFIDFDATAKLHNLNQKAKFKLMKNVGDIYCFGARKFGKCEWSENECTLSDGSIRKFKDLINQEKEVLSLNTNSLKIEKDIAIFRDNGNKECYEVVLKSGKRIVLTDNHPLLTDDDWKTVKELKINYFIAVPRKINIDGTLDIDENIAKLLGYLLGDGSCSQPTVVGFTKTDTNIIKEIYCLADYFNCSLRQRDITYFFKKKKDDNITRNKVLEIVNRYGINKLSKEKTIPDEVFKWKNKHIALLLNRLFACDSHISYLNYTIELTLASKVMVEQVQSLLLRFGIQSRIYVKKENLGFKAWRLVIAQDFDLFLDEIGIFSKDVGVRRQKDYSISDNIPNSYILKFYNNFKNKKKNRLNSLKKYSPSRNKLLKLEAEMKCPEISVLCHSDVYWDKVKTITPVGLRQTVSVETKKNHNYISNNIFSHNSMCVSILDLCSALLIGLTKKIAVGSMDLIHIKGILDPIKNAFVYHPICKEWTQGISGAPDYQLNMKNGVNVKSVNFNLGGKDPGNQWFQKHVERIVLEEESKETEEIAKKRTPAESECGAIYRASGMTDFTRHSPSGKMFYSMEDKKNVLNLPQFVNPFFDEKEKQDRSEQYGGQNSPSFRTFVKGEVVEDGASHIDMDRVRNSCYMLDSKGNWCPDIKQFDVLKDTYYAFKNFVHVERPENAERIFVATDIGKNITEIIIVSEVGEKYNYLYNITLYNLTQQQIEAVLKHIIENVNANVIAIDCGDGEGRGIFTKFQLMYPMENLVAYSGNSKIEVDFEYEENSKGQKTVKMEKVEGKLVPVMRSEHMSEHSVSHLVQKLLYPGRINIPKDNKFDSQFNGVRSKISNGRVLYTCISETQDHLFDTFKVFSIAQFIKKDFNKTPPVQKKPRCIGVMG